MLEVNNLSVKYKHTAILQDISFKLRKGEVLGIVGESGSGKSTLLRAIMGILPNDWHVQNGDICFQGRNLLELSAQELRTVRAAQIGMVFQNSAAALCPTRNIGEQVHEALNAHQRYSRVQSEKVALEVFAKLRLPEPERILRSYPFELSGGMNQRVGIALAMLLRPQILLADEPTSALDVVAQAQIIQELEYLRRQEQTAIVIVTHNIALAASFADRIVVMYQGRIVEQGASAMLVQSPQKTYTKNLIAAIPKIVRSQDARDTTPEPTE